MIWQKLLTFTVMALLILAPYTAKAQPPDKSSISPTAQPQSRSIREIQLAQSIKHYPPEEKKAYEGKIAQELNNLEQQINDLALAGRSGPPQTKRMRLRMVLTLKQQLFAAKRRLANLTGAPDQDWSSLKVEMDKTMTGLRLAYKKTAARLQ